MQALYLLHQYGLPVMAAWTAKPPAVVPVVIIVGPPTASEKEAITYEPVIKVVVLMIEVAAMIELAVVEMAFARSKVALSGTTPAANAAAHMATLHMAATPATG